MANENELVSVQGLTTFANALKTRLDKLTGTVTAVYTPAGSLDSPDPSKLIKENVGKVYNISKEFTTESDNFLEGDGKKYPAGTNIVVIESETDTYKFDALSGIVDLSEYSTTSAVQSMITSSIEGEIADTSVIEQIIQEVFESD